MTKQFQLIIAFAALLANPAYGAEADNNAEAWAEAAEAWAEATIAWDDAFDVSPGSPAKIVKELEKVDWAYSAARHLTIRAKAADQRTVGPMLTSAPLLSDTVIVALDAGIDAWVPANAANDTLSTLWKLLEKLEPENAPLYLDTVETLISEAVKQAAEAYAAAGNASDAWALVAAAQGHEKKPNQPIHGKANAKQGLSRNENVTPPLVSAFPEKVNINMADAETIAAGLHGIGPAKAHAIIEYREENGPFKSVEELLNVNGIGPKTIERIRADVLLEGGPK